MRLQDLIDRARPRRGPRGPERPSAPPAAGTGPDPATSPLEAAEVLVAEGRVVEAVDLLADANRRGAAGEVEARLVELRQEASSLLTSTGRSPWPPVHPDPFPEVRGRLPEVAPEQLDDVCLGGAVAHHGCLLVRGLYGAAQAEATVEVIRRVEERRNADGSAAPDRWYRPFPGVAQVDRGLRRVIAGQGGTWLADSPAGTAMVLDGLADSGALGAIAGHFGERPLFSLQKSTLRRSPPIHNFAGWHQDGSFLGPRARAMNVWIALTACGGDIPTPGMEVVPRRVEEILPTDGGLGSASVSDQSVARAAGDTPPICPRFAPGDAMLFDERFLHRTHLTPNMTTERFALECWFFAPAYDAIDYLSFLA